MKKAIAMLILVLLAAGLVFGQGFDFDFPGDRTGVSGSNSSKAMDRADDAQDKMNGLIPMRFFNALDRTPIVGAVVEIPNAGSFTTDEKGKITFPKIQDGIHTLVFSADGFISTNIDFRVLLGAVDFNWYSISPGIPDKDYRIVLDWGERPADLDLHFVKTSGSGRYHISYLDMQRADDGNAVLDRDDRAGYGPETITIGRIDNRATYTCYVHDYTNRSNTSSTQMAQSGATVRIYSRNVLLRTIHIPANARGTRWNLFSIERGVLTDINTVAAN